MKLLNDFFYLGDTTTVAGETECGIRFDPQHAIYRAHFPGNPITPGVCMIQLVGELLEVLAGRRLMLKRIANVKFQHVLSPVEYPACRVVFHVIETRERLWKIKASLREGEIRFAQLSMLFEEPANDESETR